jgi:3-oxoacid CoA-transferase subunit B
MLVSGLADHPPRRTANYGKPAWSCRSDFWERDLRGRAPSKGMGSAIDLVAGVIKKVVVVMGHASKNGEPKILKKCNLLLTGTGVVDLIITDMSVLQVDENGGDLTLIEIAPGVTVDDIKVKTRAEFKVAV